MKYFRLQFTLFALLLSLTFVEFNSFSQENSFYLEEVASSDYRWTGVAVSEEGRMFVNFPRWGVVPLSVAEVINKQIIPYPNNEWNTWDASTTPENHFVCVQSVYVDKKNYLWILDPASIGGSVVNGGPKLLKVDLQTDSIIQIIYFNDEVAPLNSYLNDIRVDTELNFAYLTCSGLGAIIVVDLNSGQSRRLLTDHYSTKAEDISLTINGQSINFDVHSDGLALSDDGNELYYKALTGRALYKISASALRDESLTNSELENEVVYVTETIPCDAMEFDPDGYLYFTSIEDNSIYRFLPSNELSLIVTDDRLKWPDSFSITHSGDIYVTNSRIYFPPGKHSVFQIKRTTTDIEGKEDESLNDFRMYQNYPNPFNPNTTIKYSIAEDGLVKLSIFNAIGKEVQTLTNEYKEAGNYEISFDAESAPGKLTSGVYFYSLDTDNFKSTRKMILLR
jgi:sugar lactone lactonase YvrE